MRTVYLVIVLTAAQAFQCRGMFTDRDAASSMADELRGEGLEVVVQKRV